LNIQESNKRKLYISIRWKMVFQFTILFTLIYTGIFYRLYNRTTQLTLENLFQNMLTVAYIAAEGIDGDIHQDLYKNPDFDDSMEWPKGMVDERYWKMAQWLFDVHKSNPRAYLYTYLSPEPGVVEFIVSHGAVMDPVEGAQYRERYIPSSPSVILNGLKEQTLSTDIVTDKWGSWVSGFVPIFNSEKEIVAAVGVDFRADDVLVLQNEMKLMAVPAFVLAYFILLIFVFVISSWISKPLISLSQVAVGISDGDYRFAKMDRRKIRDEVSTLKEVFNLMVENVQIREKKLKDMSERLRALYQANIDKQEEERTALALNIHDDVLNELSVLSMESISTDSPEFTEKYQRLTQRLRQMITSLRPTMLNYGLWSGLVEYTDELSERIDAGINIILNIPPSDVRYETKVEEHLYRIVQQACENTLRHAQAKTIRISGALEQELINLVVEDDGFGFDFGQQGLNLLPPKRFGLAGMFERADLINAILTVDSEPGQGTRISISWSSS
jgi:signal transduction histidine kinase